MAVTETCHPCAATNFRWTSFDIQYSIEDAMRRVIAAPPSNLHNITAAGAVDREFYSGFCGISIFFRGFWGPGGVPAARPQNSASDGLRESPR